MKSKSLFNLSQQTLPLLTWFPFSLWKLFFNFFSFFYELSNFLFSNYFSYSYQTAQVFLLRKAISTFSFYFWSYFLFQDHRKIRFFKNYSTHFSSLSIISYQSAYCKHLSKKSVTNSNFHSKLSILEIGQFSIKNNLKILFFFHFHQFLLL